LLFEEKSQPDWPGLAYLTLLRVGLLAASHDIHITFQCRHIHHTENILL